MKKTQLVNLIKEIVVKEMLSKGSSYKDKDLLQYRKDISNKYDLKTLLGDYLTKENLPQSLINVSILRWEAGKDARIDGVLVDDIIHKSLDIKKN